MASSPYGYKQQKAMTQPINQVYHFFKSRARLQVWLADHVNTRLEGRLAGFDEYMNFVLDEATEVCGRSTVPRRPLGRILIKGENITLVSEMPGGSGQMAPAPPA